MANQVTNDYVADHLVKKLVYRKAELLSALSSPEFYIEWLIIGLAIMLAGLLAMLVRRRVDARLAKHPPKRIDIEFITKPLTLLAPLLTLLYLSIARPMIERYAEGGLWTDAVMHLCIAYVMARIVLLIVHSRPVAWFIAVVVMVVAVLNVTGFLQSTTAYLNSLAFEIGQFHLSILNLVNGIVMLVIVFWIAGLLSRTLESYLRRSSSLSYNSRELTVKFFTVFIYFTALLITLSSMGVDLTAFAVFSGALGVGIGLGLQKVTSNFVSGITLLMEKSVQIGDLVEVGPVSGWVRQLNIRYALIETNDGREVLIPNEEFITTRVTNWTHTTNMARIDITVGVGYDSDPAKVRDIMLSAARDHPRCVKKKDYEPSCFLREFGDNALNFLLIFWIPDVRDGRYGTQSDVMIAILAKFKETGIDIPFPQRDVRIISKTPIPLSS